MTPSKSTAILLACTFTFLAHPVAASDNPGAHQHGHAELQLAIEGDRIDLIFSSPAYNLLGFEHRARTDHQQALVDDTTEWLGQTPLVEAAGQGCTVATATVHHQAGGHHDHHKAHHGEDYKGHHREHHGEDYKGHHQEHHGEDYKGHHQEHHGGDDKGHHGGHHDAHDNNHKHHDDHGHGHSETSVHSDFEVSQTLTCSNLAGTATLTTPLTERFPDIQHLAVEWVWQAGQGSTRLEQGESRFALGAD